MSDKRIISAEHAAIRQRVGTDLGFSHVERLNDHRKRYGLLLLPLSCLMSCALGIGLMPLLDPNVGNMSWAQNHLVGAALWSGATLVVWAILSWLGIPAWKIGIFVVGYFVVITARAESGGNSGWMLTPTGAAFAVGMLSAGYMIWGYHLPLALARRRQPASSDPSEKDVNNRIARVAGSVSYEELVESNTVRFVYERVVPEAGEEIVAFHDAGLRTSWVLTTHRLHYFHGDSPKKRGSVNFDAVAQWLVTEGVIFITIEFLMRSGTTVEVEDILETPPINKTSRGSACRGEHGGHLIKYRCPFCRARLESVTKEMAGDIGVCPKCRKEFTIKPGQ